MPPKSSSGLIVGGVVVPCEVPVFNWHDTGLEFHPGDGARKRAKTLIDLFVWHWTGGEGNAQTLFNVLDGRELGVEFYIDQEGWVYQFADPLFTDTFDAGAFNPRSVGCEISCYGFTGKDREPPGEWGKKRETYVTMMNGRRRVFARFFPAQIKSAMALGLAISNAIPSIPKVVPVGPDWKLYPNEVPDRLMRPRGGFKGHVGHYHLTDQKSDPGHDLLQAFLDSKKFEGARIV